MAWDNGTYLIKILDQIICCLILFGATQFLFRWVLMSLVTTQHTFLLIDRRGRKMRSDLRFTRFCSLGQINPHLFQVSLNLVSVYHCAFAYCFITRLEVLEGKLSMKRLKRSTGWKKIENKEINLTSLTAISFFHSAPQSVLTLSDF